MHQLQRYGQTYMQVYTQRSLQMLGKGTPVRSLTLQRKGGLSEKNYKALFIYTY